MKRIQAPKPNEDVQRIANDIFNWARVTPVDPIKGNELIKDFFNESFYQGVEWATNGVVAEKRFNDIYNRISE